MSSVDTRIAALFAALERRRLEQEEPVDELSASLFAFEDTMAALDDLGIAALAAECDEDGRQILTLEQARAFADEYKNRAVARRRGALRR